MFPSNLQKNIAQLDRQISLLEKECENMETETKRKSEPMRCKSSRVLKSPKVRASVKRNDCSKRNKITPPRPARIQSSSSMQSQCSKSWNDNSGSLVEKKSKSCGGTNYLQGCGCQSVNQIQCNLKKDSKCKSSPCNGNHLTDLAEGENIYVNNRDHVLHKEVLFPNPGGTIEVTVTQKSKSKENSPVIKTINVASGIEKNVESCKCQIKGPKWSEILYLESIKNREMNNGNYIKSQTSTGMKDLVIPSPKTETRVLEQNHFNKNNADEGIKKANFEAPVKLSPALGRNKNIPDANRMHFQEIQNCVEDNCEKRKKSEYDVELNKNCPVYSPSRDLPQKSNLLKSSSGLKNDFFLKLQQNYVNVMKEKDKLAEELTAKENMLTTMKKREEEYHSLISSLRTCVEKLKVQVQEDAKHLKELDTVTAKLAEQEKISGAIKKRHLALQDMFERCALENHKLQTQIKLLKLEAKKHDLLLAGKDAEINRYKEEIKNFQRQLSEHIELLKSSSQGLDVEKMMEAIIQQSQLFFRSDMPSVFDAGDQKDTSKPNALMHSSPTSTKTSPLNSSWNDISSIHERDHTKAESDFVINLKEDSPVKEFFQILGDGSSSGTKSPETFIDKLSGRKNIKNSSSFTSCMSLRDGSRTSESDDDVPEKEKPVSEPDVNKLALRKVKSNIDELLKNLKLKWSKEIFENSIAGSTIKDFLNDSQISSVTQ